MKKKLPILILVLILFCVGLIGVTIVFNKQRNGVVNPDKMAPQLQLAEDYLQKGEIERAIEVYQKILEVDESHQHAHLNLAYVFLIRGEKEKAFEHGRYLLEDAEEKKDAKVLTDLGSIFAQHNYLNMAFVCYVKAQQLDNFYKDVYLELGKWYGNQEKFIEAISVWRDGLLVDPDDERFKQHIKQALELRKEKQNNLNEE